MNRFRRAWQISHSNEQLLKWAEVLGGQMLQKVAQTIAIFFFFFFFWGGGGLFFFGKLCSETSSVFFFFFLNSLFLSFLSFFLSFFFFFKDFMVYTTFWFNPNTGLTTFFHWLTGQVYFSNWFLHKPYVPVRCRRISYGTDVSYLLSTSSSSVSHRSSTLYGHFLVTMCSLLCFSCGRDQENGIKNACKTQRAS